MRWPTSTLIVLVLTTNIGGATSLLDGAGSSFLRRKEEIMLALVLFTAMVAPVLLAARGVAVSKSDGSPNRALAAYRHMEDGLLAAAGFKPEEGGEFWRRDGVCFARGAALQNAWRERREHKGRETSEET